MLGDAETIRYRQEIFKDLEQGDVYGCVSAFAQRMRDMRARLAQAAKLRYRYQQDSWFVDAVDTYCDAVGSLACDLAAAEVRSPGLNAFRGFLSSYVESAAFTALVAGSKTVREGLGGIRYCVHRKGLRVSVRKYDDETDYSADVLATFERFKQGGVKDYRVRFRADVEMNQVEERIADLVAQLFPEAFSALDDYRARHRDYLDPTIRAFDREVQFYVSYLELIAPLRSAGLHLCYPDVSGESKDVFAYDTFDLALANKLTANRHGIVCNDFSLTGAERVFVVSGPNQGGKTTFARTFGQLHHLACLGYPVPGSKARLFVFDKLFTHFAKEEDLSNFSGKLEDDIVRVRDILNDATPDSIVVINEIFASTTLNDALFLARKVLDTIIELGLLCVFVTFLDELASISEATVSMVSTVVADNPAERTYKVVRKPADGLAYALAIAEKYGLTQDRLSRRLAP